MSSAEERRMLALAPPRATAVSPAVTNSARNLGLSPAPTRVPSSLAAPPRTATPARTPSSSPTTSQSTLIPSNLEAAGRAGGANLSTTPTGAVRANPTIPGIQDSLYAQTPGANLPGRTTSTGSGGGGGGQNAGGQNAGGGGGGGSDNTGGSGGGQTAGPVSSPIDAAAALDSAINALLNPEFIGFQGDRAAELRRLQNMRNQLFGDAEFGQTGSVQRQEGLDEQSRRRLAAQRASAGMLQGGAYGGTERGLGTLQRAGQDFAMQEMQRPFREQTASDRLREFGLEFDPTNRIFDQMDMDQAGFATQTQAGREAAARAKLAAIQQLAQQGIQI